MALFDRFERFGERKGTDPVKISSKFSPRQLDPCDVSIIYTKQFVRATDASRSRPVIVEKAQRPAQQVPVVHIPSPVTQPASQTSATPVNPPATAALVTSTGAAVAQLIPDELRAKALQKLKTCVKQLEKSSNQSGHENEPHIGPFSISSIASAVVELENQARNLSSDLKTVEKELVSNMAQRLDHFAQHEIANYKTVMEDLKGKVEQTLPELIQQAQNGVVQVEELFRQMKEGLQSELSHMRTERDQWKRTHQEYQEHFAEMDAKFAQLVKHMESKFSFLEEQTTLFREKLSAAYDQTSATDNRLKSLESGLANVHSMFDEQLALKKKIIADLFQLQDMIVRQFREQQERHDEMMKQRSAEYPIVPNGYVNEEAERKEREKRIERWKQMAAEAVETAKDQVMEVEKYAESVFKKRQEGNSNAESNEGRAATVKPETHEDVSLRALASLRERDRKDKDS